MAILNVLCFLTSKREEEVGGERDWGEMGRDWRDEGSKEFEKAMEKHSRRELDTKTGGGKKATCTKRQKTKVEVFLKETERNIKLWQSFSQLHVREGVCE